MITHSCNFPHLDVHMHLGFLEPLTYELILFMNNTKKCKKDKNILWAEILPQTFLIGCHLTAGLSQVFNFCRNTKKAGCILNPPRHFPLPSPLCMLARFSFPFPFENLLCRLGMTKRIQLDPTITGTSI